MIILIQKRNKRAQGALEFLMTYGWAFLVILIMIGALAYFGVLSPTKFLPERCTFGTQFLCKDYLLSYNSGAPTISLQLQNNLGQVIYVTSVDATSQEGFGGCVVTSITTDSGATDIYDSSARGSAGTASSVSDGKFFAVVLDCTDTGGMTEGSKYKVQVDLTYFAATSSSSFSHTVQGEVFANVEA